MTPAPLPSPSPTKTTAPQPTATVTVTHTVSPKPDDAPLTDQLQGWGTVGAVVAALAVALVTSWAEGRRRKRDQAEAERLREQDRADADRRLHEEREVGDRRLREQFDQQNDRDAREYLVKQLERVAELYIKHVTVQKLSSTEGARKELKHHPGRLALRILPERFATLARWQVTGEKCAEATRRLTELRQQHAVDQLPMGIVEDATFAEMISNVSELLGRTEPSHDRNGTSDHLG